MHDTVHVCMYKSFINTNFIRKTKLGGRKEKRLKKRKRKVNHHLHLCQRITMTLNELFGKKIKKLQNFWQFKSFNVRNNSRQELECPLCTSWLLPPIYQCEVIAILFFDVIEDPITGVTKKFCSWLNLLVSHSFEQELHCLPFLRQRERHLT